MEYVAIISAVMQAIPAVADMVQNFATSGQKKAEIDAAVSQYAQAMGLIPSGQELNLAPELISQAASQQVQDARKSALAGLSEMAAAKGMDDGSRQAVRQAQLAAEQNQRSQMAGIESEMRQRGQAGGPAQYLMQAGAAADANNQLSSASYQAAADARKRALEAMMSSGTMANQIDAAERARQEFNASVINATNAQNAARKMDLASLRLNAAKDLYGIRSGAMANKNAVDNQAMGSAYGAAAQAGGVFKEIANQSRSEAMAQQQAQQQKDGKK